MSDDPMPVNAGEMEELADLIESGDGLMLMRPCKETPLPFQLGIKRTAAIVAALRSAAKAARAADGVREALEAIRDYPTICHVNSTAIRELAEKGLAALKPEPTGDQAQRAPVPPAVGGGK